MMAGGMGTIFEAGLNKIFRPALLIQLGGPGMLHWHGWRRGHLDGFGANARTRF